MNTFHCVVKGPATQAMPFQAGTHEIDHPDAVVALEDGRLQVTSVPSPRALEKGVVSSVTTYAAGSWHRYTINERSPQ